MPICFGLLSHSRAWRACAVIVLQLELVLLSCALLVGLALIPTGHFAAPVLALPIFLLVLWQYRVLQRPEIRALFVRASQERGMVHERLEGEMRGDA